MYLSAVSFATAGQPKGIELTYNSLTSGVTGHVKRSPIMHNKYDIYIVYLSLAHVFELIIDLCLLIVGVPVSPTKLINFPPQPFVSFSKK